MITYYQFCPNNWIVPYENYRRNKRFSLKSKKKEVDMSIITDDVIQKVWEKGEVVSNNNPDVWRKDYCGAWIGRKHYGDRKSQYGWEIDHITPESKGGGNELSNLRPLQWQNNASKQAGKLTCVVKASGEKNVPV